MSATAGMQRLDLGMSNFDQTIDDGFEEALRAEPGEVYGEHAGWNFCGYVWFEDDQFHEEVWCYGSIRKTVSRNSLADLMRAVNEQFGHD